MSQTEPELKACPWEKPGEPHVVYIHTLRLVDLRKVYKWECSTCCHSGFYLDTREAATLAWNTRPREERLRAALERIRRILNNPTDDDYRRVSDIGEVLEALEQHEGKGS